ncbi:MAG TPA: MraY family glycosyltransferase [Gemmatimonadaceae bacterium]|nr:MraY family glycosyltransferase [Gemmatimonadaceae bacterium]
MEFVAWLVAAFALAVTLGLVITPLVILGASKLKLFDSPGARRLHLQPVPRIGGVAVYASAAAVVALLFVSTETLFISAGPWGDESLRFLFGAIIGSAILFLVGLFDDVRGLSPAIKSLAQVGAATVAWYYGAGFESIALGYGEGIHLGVLAFPLFLVWVVGVTNAVNFIDGLNGLAGGIGVVGFTAISVAGLALGNRFVILPCVALAGALIGFLRYNYPKGRIFLGDSGSLSVGFMLAIFSLKASINAFGAVLVVLPLLAMFVPLMDGLLAIVRRWLRHVPLSGADARHIHHRLLALGISQERTALILWGLAASMALFGLLLALTAPYVASSIALLGLVAATVLLIYGTNLLSYHELVVAGEVLMSAPARARRVISDQILALDLTGLISNAESSDEVATILGSAGAQFGFLAMQLSGSDIAPSERTDELAASSWAWRLDYPIRVGGTDSVPSYVLSIWCSPELSTRPYGAERLAKIVGPALEAWFESQRETADGHPPGVSAGGRKRPSSENRRLKLS